VGGPEYHRKEAYEPFFGLHEAPFSLAPDPRFLFASASHSAALAEIAYALKRREPLVVVTGEIGTGKTLLCRTVVQGLEQKTFLSIINDPLVDRDEILKQMLQDFAVISKDRTRLAPTTRHELIEALHDFLRTLIPLGAHAVVIVDEAQYLAPDVLEQIRLLSNIDDKHEMLLQIILVGQPHLDATLARPDLRQLQQRISRRIRLEPLTGDEVRKYIEHRLDVVRGDTPHGGVEFAPESIVAIEELSRGLPRLINLLCDRSLEAAHAARLHVVGRECVDTAVRALGLGEPLASTDPIATPSTQPAARTASAPSGDERIPRAFPPKARPARPRVALWMVVAASVVLAALGTWLGTSASRLATPIGQASPPPETNASSRPAATALNQSPAPPPADARPADRPAALPSIAADVSATDRYDILVAAFRTDARATAVAAEVTALGLPGRKQALESSWHQVLCGPFASRGEAEEAQERLLKAGLTGTQIVLVAR